MPITTAHHCKSLRPGPNLCADGFPQSGACYGHRCHSCGAWAAEKKPPACMSEDLEPHIVDEDGKTRPIPHRPTVAP